jgi:hypothetical protein
VNWIARVLSHYGEPSTKRHVMAIAAIVLCGVFLMIGVACGFWIRKNGDLGAGAVGALTFSGGLVATLAGVAYRKKESEPIASVGSMDVPEHTPGRGGDIA